MPRRFNYTDRKRIRREDATIRLHEDDQGLRFTAELHLGGYGLERVQPVPRVYIEAYRGASTQWRRFDFGPLDVCHAPADCGLDDFGDPEGIHFRVKVTGTGGDTAGRLLAAADGIRPVLPDASPGAVRPLIQHAPTHEIGDELWRIDFGGTEPLLLVNDQVPGGIGEYLRDPLQRASIMPAVMRRVLERILIIDDDGGDDDDDTSWQRRWLRFGAALCGTAPPEGAADKEDLARWIDDAVEAFARRFELLPAMQRAHELESHA